MTEPRLKPTAPGTLPFARAPGRPRRPGTDESILRATLDLIGEGGVAAATISAVAARTGVARASIYLRWPNGDALVTAAIRRAIGREPFELSGDLVTDLHRGAEQARAILAEARFRRILPALIASLLDEGEESLTYHAMFPNRRRLADEYRELAASSGLRTDVDPYVPIDMIVGGLLNRLLASGRPASAAAARETADAAIDAMRRPPEAEPSRRRPSRPK